jgi:putative acetyltransferase
VVLFIFREVYSYQVNLMPNPTDSEIEIRPIKIEDNKEMAAVIREVMTSYGCQGPGFAMLDSELDCLAESYDAADHIYYVVTHNGRVLGGAGIAPLLGGAAGVCELRKMYFLPTLRGRGLGWRLGELCLTAAAKLGYSTCYLETLEFMKDARRLYEKLGFQRLEETMGKTGHFGCDYFYAIELQRDPP